MIFQLYMYIYISLFVILVIKRRAHADISADGCRWRLRASSPPCLSLPFLEGGGVCICWVIFSRIVGFHQARAGEMFEKGKSAFLSPKHKVRGGRCDSEKPGFPSAML